MSEEEVLSDYPDLEPQLVYALGDRVRASAGRIVANLSMDDWMQPRDHERHRIPDVAGLGLSAAEIQELKETRTI